jgi:hypothetical protein
MSYYYEDDPYEYDDNGNYGDNNYKDDYESYSDHAESDHGDPDPDPSKFDNTNYDDTTPIEYEDVEVNWEVYSFEEFESVVNEGYEHEVNEGEYEHGQGEVNGNEDELGELRYENEVATNEGYKLGELERDEDEMDRRGELEHEGEYALEYEIAEELAHELESNVEASYEAYEPQGLEYHHNYALETSDDTYEHGALEHDNDNDAHVLASAYHDAVELLTPSNTTYVPAHLVPVYHPNTYHPIPAPIPPKRDLFRSNKSGHVTALQHRTSALNDECNNDGNLAYHHPEPLSSTSTYLNTLRRDYDNGVPSAVTYMQQLQKYNKECLYEQGEWKADERAEIRRNHNIKYPKRDDTAIPRSWRAINEPGHGLPHTIEESRPLGHGLKRRRYRNARTPRYHISQPRPPLVPRPPLELDDNVAPSIAPSPTTCSNRHYCNNHTPKPLRNIDANTTPSSTSRSRPPPWPNKNSNKNRNKYYYGTHTPAGMTAKQRPPPWPIILTPTPILSIKHSRPPPWPIIPHRIHSTSQNCRNAKRRIKAKSRVISDEVSI